MVSDWVSVGGGGDVVCADANEYIVAMPVCEKYPRMYYAYLWACMYAYLVSMCVYVCA